MEEVAFDLKRTKILITSFVIFNNTGTTLPEQDLHLTFQQKQSLFLEVIIQILFYPKHVEQKCSWIKQCKLWQQLFKITSSLLFTTKVLKYAFPPIPCFHSVDYIHLIFICYVAPICVKNWFPFVKYPFLPPVTFTVSKAYLIVVLRFLFLSLTPTFSLYKAVVGKRGTITETE